ncbi:MAG: ferritin family protein [Dehalococcoidales bacterium]
MSIHFTSEEIINLAIDIERRGIAFYDTMARSTESAALSSAFQFLVNMERQHVQIFLSMRAKAGGSQALENYTAEHSAYLDALAASAVFTDDMVTSEMATKINSDIEALELAISAEKDSILFYYELWDIMPQTSHSLLSQVIAEEKSHLRQLSQLKKEFQAGG